MSTLTPAKPDAARVSAAPVRTVLRGPTRVLLRLHRRVLWGAGTVSLVAIVGMVAVALGADRVAADFAATGCTLSSTAESCFGPARVYTDHMLDLDRLLGYVGLALLALPAVMGAFVAGPLIAREWESGSIKLSWTQSSRPSVWLVTRLAVPTALVVCGITALSAVHVWALGRIKDPFPAIWYDLSYFGASGTVPAAAALMALAVGALAGLVLRRTVPAMAVSLFVSGLVATALVRLRDSMWPTTRDTFTPGSDYVWPDRAAVVEWGYMTSGGDRLSSNICADPSVDFEVCLSEHGGTTGYLEYHPASHYWPLQLVETGVLLALAALAVYAAFRVLRRLHG
ncbi:MULTISPECIES: hypothetical protein [unclassified Streptomyces]|uniref:hypothetical protein n=1 Tax=unclassified Streptomyces TaxID=2593676 RepID=UPI001F25A560|nr:MULTISPECIES: hypothetical protein [unclassified Streptomyces]